MKFLKIILVFSFIFFGLHTKTQAQTVKKVAVSEMPKKIQETLKQYSDYKVEGQVDFLKKSSQGKNVYRIKMSRKGINYIYVINKKGKIIAVETGETNKPNKEE